MSGNFLNFTELVDCVIVQLKEQNYMESTLTIYRRIYNRIHSLMQQRGTEVYTNEIGHAFLGGTHVCKSTYGTYLCAIRRLDDYIEGSPYRCHHGNPGEEVPEVFKYILNEYLDACVESGNKKATATEKKKSCILFLKYVAQTGCTDISSLDAGLAAQALLIYTNKDNYARIRQFLKHLADKGYTQTDFSGVVPRYKRRKVLPTTYTPSEIARVENAVDTTTDTGKRDLAIIRIATRMGFRSGDIAKLKWSEVDLENGYIHITQEKTGEPLSLRMPDDVSEAIVSHLENTAFPGRDDGFVFHSMSAPYNRITTGIIRHAVIKYFNAAGIDTKGKKHGPHAFRSSLASSMVNDGASYETVRRILGHSDPDVIKHYAKTDIENLRLYSLEPPEPEGIFKDYLSGRRRISSV